MADLIGTTMSRMSVIFMSQNHVASRLPSPVADDSPPKHPDAGPDDQAQDGYEEADLPPGRLANVAKSKIHWSGPRPIVSEAGIQIREVRKHQRCQQRGGSGRKRSEQKGRVK